MTSFKWICCALVLFCSSTWAYVDNNVMLKGKLLQYDAKVAILEIDHNQVKVPTRVVTAMGYKSGQNVVVFVDFRDLVDMNMKQLIEKGIVKAPETKKSSAKD